jgi:hypothetical protein
MGSHHDVALPIAVTEHERREAVRAERVCGCQVDRRGTLQRVLRHACQKAANEQRNIWLVERRRDADEIAQVFRCALAIAREEIAGAVAFPSAAGREPARRGEMPERHHRGEAVLVTRRQHAPVVFELRVREEALFRLYARPLD